MHKTISKENLIISFIGAGKIAYTLIPVLSEAGYNIDTIFCRNKDSAKVAAHKFKIKNFSNNISKLSDRCNLIFIAVPDNQIKVVTEELSKLKFEFINTLFVHLSGSKTIEELESLKINGAEMFILYNRLL